MKTSLRLIVLLLLVVPALSVLYKVFVLNLSFLPLPIRDEWTIQVQIDGRAFDDLTKFSFPIPQTSARQAIRDLSYQNSGLQLDIKDKDGDYAEAQWSGPISSTASFGYQFNVRTSSQSMDLPRSERSRRIPSGFQKYLDIKHLTTDELNQIKAIEQTILESKTDKLDSLKRIFFYVSEEIKRSSNYDTIRDAIDLGRGSAFVKTKLFDALTRRAGIPSRISFGLVLDSEGKKKLASNRHRLVFMNEVYLNGNWYPVDLENRSMGSYPHSFVVFHSDISNFRPAMDIIRSLPFYAQPVQVNRYNSKAYYDELRRTDSAFSQISLYHLPIASQNSLYLILLLPFGTVILSLFRNILGFSTFGIFTPILLTIFFLETPFTFAILFMSLIVFIGFFQRILLDKLYLLAVPRISILLTFVIIAYIIFIIFNHSDFVIGKMRPIVLSYFPVVIITVLIERFSVDFTEEGPWNTFKKLLGTLIISFCCYVLFMIESLKLMIFTHPELMLIAVGLNLMIGSYKGYRLSEFLRFQDLARKIRS